MFWREFEHKFLNIDIIIDILRHSTKAISIKHENIQKLVFEMNKIKHDIALEIGSNRYNFLQKQSQYNLRQRTKWTYNLWQNNF